MVEGGHQGTNDPMDGLPGLFLSGPPSIYIINYVMNYVKYFNSNISHRRSSKMTWRCM